VIHDLLARDLLNRAVAGTCGGARTSRGTPKVVATFHVLGYMSSRIAVDKGSV